MNDTGIVDYVATAICKKFGVSDQVISRRVQKEKLWPIPD